MDFTYFLYAQAELKCNETMLRRLIGCTKTPGRFWGLHAPEDRNLHLENKSNLISLLFLIEFT